MSNAIVECRKYCSESIKRTCHQCLFLNIVHAPTNSQGLCKGGIRRGWKDSPVLTQRKASEQEDHPCCPPHPQSSSRRVLQGRKLASVALRLSEEGAGTGR